MEIKIPSVGESVSSADIESWEKNKGDKVLKGEVIAILETDKASMEIQAEQDGILNILKGKGETASVGEVIGFIEAPLEERGETSPSASVLESRPTSAVLKHSQPSSAAAKQDGRQGSLASSSDAAASELANSKGGGGDSAAALKQKQGKQQGGQDFQNRRENLSPSVRRIVEAQGIDPASMPVGTGRGGRLTKEDILRALSAGELAATKEGIVGKRVTGENIVRGTARGTTREITGLVAKKAERTEKRTVDGVRTVAIGKLEKTKGRAAVGKAEEAKIETKTGGERGVATENPATAKGVFATDIKPLLKQGQRRERMSSLRRKTARKLVQSQLSTATLSTFNEADMSRIIEIRNKHKEEFIQKHGTKLGFMSFFVKAVVSALHKYPKLNAFVDGEDIIYNDHQHIGIAVSTDKGLVVPVLFNAQDLSFAEIEKKIIEFRDKAVARKLSVDDLFGGTFTISNGGVFGSLLSTPVLNPPQSGILGMHKIQARPVAINKKIEIRPMMYLALSYDHQIVDGRESVGFLSEVKAKLEEPARLWMDL